MEGITTILADFVVTDNQSAAALCGHRKSARFESGERLTRAVSGVERHVEWL
jgi:hypothetical protein